MKRRALLVTTLGAGLLMSAQVYSQQQDTLDYREGYGLVLEQRWNEAQAHFIEFQVDWPESAWADDAAFWNCYAIEQSGTEQDEHFNCYREFVENHSNSTWVSDARSKLAVLGSRLSGRGNPQFFAGAFQDGDWDFDFDADEFSESIAEAMAAAEVEMERLREAGFPVPPIPPIPDLSGLANLSDIDVDVRVLRETGERMRREVDRMRIRGNRFSRNTADDELLTIISALRDNQRASAILIDKLRSSSNADMRSRIVMLLEDFEGEDVTNTLVDVINNDESEDVRNSAVFVLLDKDEESTRDLLLDIAVNPDYPVSVRAEILNNMEDWDEDFAVTTLSSILASETDPLLVSEAADSLADIGSDAALDVLFDNYQSKDELMARQLILEQIADVDSPNVITFLTDIALSDSDDQTAAIAIEGIADREDNVAIAALDHIYNNSTARQRQLAAIDGIGGSETEQAVEVLQQILAGSDQPELDAAVMRALGDTELQSAVAIVLDTYRNNSDAAVQSAAIRALRRLDDHTEATEALLEILEDQLSRSEIQ